jgi:hypothetical protein
MGNRPPSVEMGDLLPGPEKGHTYTSGFWCKVTIPSPETLGDRQENRINRALQYEHFRLKLFEVESLHQNRALRLRNQLTMSRVFSEIEFFWTIRQ